MDTFIKAFYVAFVSSDILLCSFRWRFLRWQPKSGRNVQSTFWRVGRAEGWGRGNSGLGRIEEKVNKMLYGGCCGLLEKITRDLCDFRKRCYVFSIQFSTLTYLQPARTPMLHARSPGKGKSLMRKDSRQGVRS